MSDEDGEETWTVPLVEERLHVGRRKVVTGLVRVKTEVKERQVRVDGTLSREDVAIERVPVGRYVDAIPDIRQDGDVLVYPVVEEVIVKRLFLKEEVRIVCRHTSEPFERLETLRRQHAVVERIPTETSQSRETLNQGAAMSNRTITALYDSKDAAERAKDQLKTAGVDNVDIHNQDSADSMTGTAQAAGEKTRGFFDKVAEFFGGHEDTHAYAEGLRRGHYLLTAKVDDDQADEAIRILDASNAMDFDKTQEGWRGEGWTGGLSDNKVGPEGYTAAIDAENAGGDTRGTASAYEQGSTAGRTAGLTGDLAATRTEAQGDTLKLVEEQLRVGKREVERGGVRVRSYVVETPVHEQVNLREEHVTLERRPVNQAIANADALLQDRTLELTETAEEAVVAKNAVVKEELTLRKDVSERTEEINDTVRRTEVEVQDERADAAPLGSSTGSTTTPAGQI